ncbi:tRNA (adenine(22)-N(1))-methyltransferase [Streptococcus sp. FT1-106]|uniref:tRNA (adenine(22)-N(1))-methyltransferase n=1 Tax=unclassified Streptococcus TaxID=2608887 RepID=UPI003BF4C490
MQTPLSNRLRKVAEYVPEGARLLDVGSDHAYLPIYLIEKGHIDFAIAGEVVKGPYESAVSNVANAQMTDKIDVRLADGLAAFEESDQISVITICGMGGYLIAEILANGRAKLDKVERLILQPNNREDELRNWLAQHGFRIVAETIMTENDKFYEIMVAEHGDMTLSVQEHRFGPYLNQEKSAVFKAKWQRELNKLQIALSHVPISHEADRFAISQKITAIKEALNDKS